MPNNHILLQRITLTATSTSVTFNNIPQTGYNDLKIIVSGRSTSNDGSPWTGINLAFNGSSANQSAKRLLGNGSSALSDTGTNLGGLVSGNTATANTFGNSEIYISDYNLLYAKSISTDTVTENNGTSALVGIVTGLWNPSVQESIYSITLSCANGNFDVGSTFSIYGIANSVTTPLLSSKASGGDIIRTDGTYWYHAFLSSGIFTPQSDITTEYILIAGGAGGGGYSSGGGSGGGGGAGGALYAWSKPLISRTNYTVLIGAGGAGGTSIVDGFNGVDTFFSNSNIKGGGGGASHFSTGSLNGKIGGCGGGATEWAGSHNGGGVTGPFGTNIISYGNAGGASNGSLPGTSGGGGGVGTAGSSSTVSGVGAAGGNGLNIWSSWASTTGTGVSGYYAGGGGGGGSSTGGAGGLGGGGNGSINATANNGIANSGGGGGGNRATSAAGAGGSGIVILRYPV